MIDSIANTHELTPELQELPVISKPKKIQPKNKKVPKREFIRKLKLSLMKFKRVKKSKTQRIYKKTEQKLKSKKNAFFRRQVNNLFMHSLRKQRNKE